MDSVTITALALKMPTATPFTTPYVTAITRARATATGMLCALLTPIKIMAAVAT